MEELLNFYICLSTQLLIFSGFEGNLFWSLPLIVFLFSFLQVYHHALLLAASQKLLINLMKFRVCFCKESSPYFFGGFAFSAFRRDFSEESPEDIDVGLKEKMSNIFC